MHLFHILQCTIQNKNVHISVLNDALWDMEQVHCGICEIGLFFSPVMSIVTMALCLGGIVFHVLTGCMDK